MTAAVQIAKVSARVFRCPLSQPVTTSFGVMRDRPMVLVEVEDKEGAKGWGEVWCNFPAVGAEHRARLVDSVMAPLMTSRPFQDACEAFAFLTARTAVLALQSSEPGPFAQAIAGVDTALWDLAARRAGLPLWKLLSADGTPRIRVYASGLNPDAPEKLAAERQAEGYRAFKLKIGFGAERDVANLTALREVLGSTADLMVDANQAWDADTAIAMLPKLAPFGLKWLEEPVRADTPWRVWADIGARTEIALAGGENIAGESEFARALEAGVLGVVQPDLAKWGGLTGCRQVARRILASGKRFCPHYLGGGVGLLASAHLLAAVGGDGALEIDANPNPLRSELCGDLARITAGEALLSEAPGLGIVPDLAALERYRVAH